MLAAQLLCRELTAMLQGPAAVHQAGGYCVPGCLPCCCVLTCLTDCRGVELVEGVVRSHIGACFEALQQRIAAAISTARQTAQDAAAGGPNAGKPSGEALLQVRSTGQAA